MLEMLNGRIENRIQMHTDIQLIVPDVEYCGVSCIQIAILSILFVSYECVFFMWARMVPSVIEINS